MPAKSRLAVTTPRAWSVSVDRASGLVEIRNAETGVTIAVMDDDNADVETNVLDATLIVTLVNRDTYLTDAVVRKLVGRTADGDPLPPHDPLPTGVRT